MFDSQPPAWTAGEYPWGFVITLNSNGNYAASANDARTPVAYIPLGATFTTREDAEQACRDFLLKTRRDVGNA